jgi:hypothetical protein
MKWKAINSSRVDHPIVVTWAAVREDTVMVDLEPI